MRGATVSPGAARHPAAWPQGNMRSEPTARRGPCPQPPREAPEGRLAARGLRETSPT